MTDERDTFESTRARLDDIAAQVRKKDTSLDQSIELLEEGVRLANLCTEQVDQASLATSTVPADEGADVIAEPVGASEVVTAEDVVRAPAAPSAVTDTGAPGASNGDDFDLSDAWSELDDATDHDGEPAINDSQEVLELAAEDDSPAASTGDVEADEG